MVSKKVTDRPDTFDPAAAELRRAGAGTGGPLSGPLLLLAALAVAGLCVAALLIDRAAERERAQMLAAIHGRADSLVWALEGGARLLEGTAHGGGTGGLAPLVAEVARQPGVAWIAITDGAGRILADSNAELAGAVLYTPEELRRLAPGTHTRGRFSPDDPSIYETWRLFAPGRLRGHGRRHGPAPETPPQVAGVRCVFVALDVSGMEEQLADSVFQLWLVAGLVLVASLAVAGLALLFRRYRSSRRRLADAEAVAAQVVRNYPAGLVVLDTAGEVRLCNARARAMLGMAEKGAPALAGTGLDWPALMAELDAGAPLLERELELWRPHGDPLPVQLTAARLMGSGGEALGYLFALRDLVEVRSLERRLRQQERLSALGNLAAGLAHEIRNPLSSIRGYATYLTERLAGDPLGRATGQMLIEETGRLDRVLSDLLGLARPRKIAPAPVSLGALLSRVVAVAAPDAAEKGVRLRARLPAVETDDKASVDGDRLMQAVLNLVINAIQATEPGGEVEVELARAPAPSARGGEGPGERDAARQRQGDCWRIRVRDTGCGMSAATAAQIFTPYFTTKASGTGLGLAIARQVVEQHGGAISASSVPGGGTTMTILLPAAPAPQAGEGGA